jgi:hypothetical protein
MCDPITLTVATLAAGGISAFSAYQQGRTQQDFANYEAAQAEADARASKGEAKVEAERLRKAGKRATAEANASLAASGQDLASAGAIGINREITRGAEEDAYFALLGGENRAARLNAGATMSRARGSAAAQAGRLGAFSELLSAGYTAGTGWRQMRGGT